MTTRNNQDDIVETIKSQLNIIDVISNYTDLNGTSNVKKGLCPFYPEKTPSFVVYASDQTFKCFCGSCAGFSGGDIYSFVMRIENLEFKDALKHCANLAGISLDSKKNREDKISNKDLFSALESASDFFYSSLVSPFGKNAMEYLINRGFNEDQIKRYGFGLSPTGLNTIVSHLKKVGISSLAATKTGLVQKWADGTWHDFFIERLTIEIRDENNNLVGFGARSLNNKTPKYLNTPQTDIFSKSDLLFGLNIAKNSISEIDECIIVEGYMDVFTAHSEGSLNVVACMGTAVSLNQLKKAFSLSSRVILCLDSDIAGKKATVNNLVKIINSNESMSEINSSLWIANITSGKDPDELIRNHPDEWKSVISNSIPIYQHLIENLDLIFDLTQVSQKIEASNIIYKLIFQNSDSHIQNKILDQLANKLKIKRDELPSPKIVQNTRKSIINNPKIGFKKDNPIETHVISLLIQNPQLCEYIKNQTNDLFVNTQLRAIFDQLKSNSKIDPELDDVFFNLVQDLKTNELPKSNEKDLITELNNCINRLYNQYLKRQKQEQGQAINGLGENTNDSSSAIDGVLKDSLKTNELLKKIQSNQNN
jgi:DNA primase